MRDVIASSQLRHRRKQAGLTQREVARLAGLLQTNYSKIEQGKTNPRLATFEEIARALGLEVMLVPVELKDTVIALTATDKSPQEKPLFSIEPD